MSYSLGLSEKIHFLARLGVLAAISFSEVRESGILTLCVTRTYTIGVAPSQARGLKLAWLAKVAETRTSRLHRRVD